MIPRLIYFLSFFLVFLRNSINIKRESCSNYNVLYHSKKKRKISLKLTVRFRNKKKKKKGKWDKLKNSNSA